MTKVAPTLMAPNNSRASAAMALIALSTFVPMAENDSLVSRQRQEDRDESTSISQKQAFGR